MTLRITIDRSDGCQQVVNAVVAACSTGCVKAIEVDITTLGSGVYDRLREMGLPVEPVSLVGRR